MKYEKWNTIITIVSLAIGLSNSYLYIRGCSTSEKLAHLSLNPISNFVLRENHLRVGKISYGGKREYDPNNEIWQFISNFNPKDNFQDRISFYGSTSNIESHIAVHIFDLTYYRESDMKKYDKRVLFF